MKGKAKQILSKTKKNSDNNGNNNNINKINIRKINFKSLLHFNVSDSSSNRYCTEHVQSTTTKIEIEDTIEDTIIFNF